MSVSAAPLPDLEGTDRLITAATIADKVDSVTPQRVGRIARMLGLHRSARHSRKLPRLRIYSEAAEGLILRELKSRGRWAKPGG